MTDVWIRQRNQLTIPVDIARQAGLEAGSLCHMEFINGVITVTPAATAAERSLEYYAGIARGAWGRTQAQVEIATTSQRDPWQR